MTDKTEQYWMNQAIQISEAMTRGFYEKTIHPKEVIDFVDTKNFSWIGAAEGEIYLSWDDALTAFSHQRDMKEIPLIHVGKGKYTAQAIAEDTFLVISEIPLSTPPESGLVLAEKQRCSMIFRLKDNHLKIVHIHTSNPWTSMKNEGRFPKTVGRNNYEYLQQLVANKKLEHFPDLSNRQRLILELMSQGKTYNAIAEALSISPRTVRYHVSELFIKFKVKNKAELLSYLSKK